jgi:hypothetical protein
MGATIMAITTCLLVNILAYLFGWLGFLSGTVVTIGYRFHSVIPAQAGIQRRPQVAPNHYWIPACAGMTAKKRRNAVLKK